MEEELQNYIKLFLAMNHYGLHSLKDILMKEMGETEVTIDPAITALIPGIKTQPSYDKSLDTFENINKLDLPGMQKVFIYCVHDYNNLIDTHRKFKATNELFKFRNDLAHYSDPTLQTNKYIVKLDELKLILLNLKYAIPDKDPRDAYEKKIDQEISDISLQEPNPNFKVLGEIKTLCDNKEGNGEFMDQVHDVIKEFVQRHEAKLTEAIWQLDEKQKLIPEIPQHVLQENTPLTKQKPRITLSAANPSIQIQSLTEKIMKCVLERSSSLGSSTASATSLPLWSVKSTNSFVRSETMNYPSKMIDTLYLNKARNTKCRQHLKTLYSNDPVLEQIQHCFNENITFRQNGKRPKTYQGIFTAADSPHKAIICGEKGYGKTCSIRKIASVWALNKRTMSPVPLVIEVKQINTQMSLLQAIKEQLFSECNIKLSGIYKMIKSQPKEFLLILDGVDETTKENFGDVTQMIKETWVKSMRIWISTLPHLVEELSFPEDFLVFHLDQTVDDMLRYIDTHCKLKDENNTDLKTWIKEQAQLCPALQQDPGVLSLLCEEWSKGKPFSTPKILFQNMINSPLVTTDNSETQELVEYLALYNLMKRTNIFIQSDNNNRPNFEICTEQGSTLYQCRKNKVGDSFHYEIDFRSHLLQVYLAYLALTSEDKKIKDMVNDLMNGDYTYLLRNLLLFFKSLETLVPDEVKVATSGPQFNGVVTIHANERLLDYVTHFLPQRDQELTNQMRTLQQASEQPEKEIPSELKPFKPPLKYSLAVELKSGTLVGISSLLPEALLNSCKNRNDTFVLAFTKDQWENILFWTNLEKSLQKKNRKCALTQTINDTAEQYFKTEYNPKVVKEHSNSQGSEEITLSESIPEVVKEPPTAHAPEDLNTFEDHKQFLEDLKVLYQQKYWLPDLKIKCKQFKPKKGTSKDYATILASTDMRVIISGEQGAGKTGKVNIMLKDWREGEWDKEPILKHWKDEDWPKGPVPVLLGTTGINDKLSFKELVEQHYPDNGSYNFIKKHKNKVVLILDGVDGHLDEKVPDIGRIIADPEWKDMMIWIFVRPNELTMPDFKRYDLTATQEGMCAYIDKCHEGKEKEIKTWIGKYKELSAKLPQEPVVLAYLCKRPSEGFSDLKPRDLFDELCSEELGDNEYTRQTIEYMALCQLLLEQCHFSQETKYETTPLKEVIYVNFNSIQEQKDSLYKIRDIQKDDTTIYEIDFSSNLVQVYLASCLLISNDPRVTKVFNESIPINLINFVKSWKMFDPDLPISTNDEPPLVVMPIDPDRQISTNDKPHRIVDVSSKAFKNAFSYLPDKELEKLMQLQDTPRQMSSNDIPAVVAMPSDPDHPISTNDKPPLVAMPLNSGKFFKHLFNLLPQGDREISSGRAIIQAIMDQTDKGISSGRAILQAIMDQTDKEISSGRAIIQAIMDQIDKEISSGREIIQAFMDQTDKGISSGRAIIQAIMDQTDEEISSGRVIIQAIMDQTDKEIFSARPVLQAIMDQTDKEISSERPMLQAIIDQTEDGISTGMAILQAIMDQTDDGISSGMAILQTIVGQTEKGISSARPILQAIIDQTDKEISSARLILQAIMDQADDGISSTRQILQTIIDHLGDETSSARPILKAIMDQKADGITRAKLIIKAIKDHTDHGNSSTMPILQAILNQKKEKVFSARAILQAIIDHLGDETLSATPILEAIMDQKDDGITRARLILKAIMDHTDHEISSARPMIQAIMHQTDEGISSAWPILQTIMDQKDERVFSERPILQAIIDQTGKGIFSARPILQAIIDQTDEGVSSGRVILQAIIDQTEDGISSVRPILQAIIDQTDEGVSSGRVILQATKDQTEDGVSSGRVILKAVIDQTEDGISSARPILQAIMDISANNYSFAIDIGRKKMVGFSSLLHTELLKKIKDNLKIYHEHIVEGTYLHVSFKDDESAKMKDIHKVLQKMMLQCETNSQTTDEIGLVAKISNDKDEKELFIVFSTMQENGVSKCDIKIHCSVEDIEILHSEKRVNMNSLDLSGVVLNATHSRILKNTFPLLTNLKHCDLGGCRLLSPDKAIGGLRNIDNLEYLDIEGTNLTRAPPDRLTRVLKSVLKSHNGLQHLNIKGCRLSKKSMDSVMETICVNNTELIFLDVGYNSVSHKALFNVLTSLNKLTHLRLAHVNMTANDLKSLLNSLQQDGIKPNTELLDLSHCVILEDCVTKLCDTFPHLQQIYLKDIGSSDRIKEIVRFLKTKDIEVKELDLSLNAIKNEVVADIANLKLDLMTRLDLNDCKMSLGVTIKAIKDCHLLKWLDLSGNFVGDEGAIDLGQMSSTQLEYLKLIDCNIGSIGIIRLCPLLGRSEGLNYLNLSKNPFGYDDKATLQLAQSLNPHVEHLGLGNCHFNAKSLEAFGANLSTPRLKSLSLSGNVIYDNKSAILLKVLANKTRLEKLGLGENYKILDIVPLLSHLEGMKIKVLDANYVKESTVLTFTEALKNWDCLEKLDMSKCSLSKKSILAIVESLSGKQNFNYLDLPCAINVTEIGNTSRTDVIAINHHFKVYQGEKGVMTFELAYRRKYQYGTEDDGTLTMTYMETDHENDVISFTFEAKKNTSAIIKYLANSKKEFVSSILTSSAEELKDYPYLRILKLITPDVTELSAIADNGPASIRFLEASSWDVAVESKLFKTLQKLQLKYCKIEVICDILKNIDKFPELSDLLVKCVAYNKDLSSTLGKVKGLFKLNLELVKCGNDELLQCLSRCPQLEELSIIKSTCTDATIVGGLVKPSNLKDLRLVKNSNEEDDQKDDNSMAFENTTTLEQLGCLVNYERIESISINDRLRTILPKKDPVKKLNSIIEEGKDEGTKDKISKLLLAFNKSRVDMLNYLRSFKSLPCLTSLTLTQDICDDGARVLADNFKDLHNLQVLSLRECSITGKGFDYMLPKMKALKLVELDLSKTAVGNSNIEIAQKAFVELKCLTKLFLNYIQVTKPWLTTVLSSTTFLKSLKLVEVKFLSNSSQDDDIALIETLKQLDYLSHISLSRRLADKLNIKSDILEITIEKNEFVESRVVYYDLVKDKHIFGHIS